MNNKRERLKHGTTDDGKGSVRNLHGFTLEAASRSGMPSQAESRGKTWRCLQMPYLLWHFIPGNRGLGTGS